MFILTEILIFEFYFILAEIEKNIVRIITSFMTICQKHDAANFSYEGSCLEDRSSQYSIVDLPSIAFATALGLMRVISTFLPVLQHSVSPVFQSSSTSPYTDPQQNKFLLLLNDVIKPSFNIIYI